MLIYALKIQNYSCFNITFLNKKLALIISKSDIMQPKLKKCIHLTHSHTILQYLMFKNTINEFQISYKIKIFYYNSLSILKSFWNLILFLN